jgi:hypothetical protein
LPSVNIQPPANTILASGGPSSPGNGVDGTSDKPPGIPISGTVGSATDIYSRIASGANACWFAVKGPLKKDYIFHAAADAPSRGGKAVITIHERDPSQANPRGLKAYLVEILPTGEGLASVTVENRKMQEAYAAAMTGDITRWSKGEEGCSGPSTGAAWPPSPDEAVAASSKTPNKKHKTKPKAAQAKPVAQSAAKP